ncbi:cytochrome ubiquinol oxidase subunit I [Fodinicola acaciae]|uniref:cytochrome ubiquinol oxidase subunit I n=1 Tax=Fodinicola acaciae TaxID=2681555 RepID=UPI0013D15B1A|nr:cytochrome ubiquinol oxidase subunit I [Fodinicola acaciae]
MDAIDIARWQFGITTVYHFLMVPLTIGLGLVVATMQTAYLRTGKDHYRLMVAFWSKIFLVNFAMGVVTGLVQEFQFGLAWSEYSRFVGDVFGAPLAMEALLAFFLESTFLGLWIFGAGRLSERVRLACLWTAVLGSVASAYFILCANSWMQHPVGVEFVAGQVRMTSIWAVLTNNTALVTMAHTIAGSLAVAGSVLVGVSWWHLRKDEHPTWRRSLRSGAYLSMAAFAALAISGDTQAKLMFEQQPMKMASAEALCHTEKPASFSVFAIGDVARPECESVKSLTVPFLLSFLAHGDLTSEVRGVEQLQTQYEQRYGDRYPDKPSFGRYAGKPIDYSPILPVTYWGFRLMIGFGAIAAGLSAVALWLTRKGRMPRSKWLGRAALASVATPFLANIAGWIFTEMGRQPFVVAPNPSGIDGVFMYTVQAMSPGVTATELLVSVIALTSVYALLAVIELTLLARLVRRGLAPYQEKPDEDDRHSVRDVLSFAY